MSDSASEIFGALPAHQLDFALQTYHANALRMARDLQQQTGESLDDCMSKVVGEAADVSLLRIEMLRVMNQAISMVREATLSNYPTSLFAHAETYVQRP